MRRSELLFILFQVTLGVNTKTCSIGFPSTTKMLQVFVAISQKFCCRKAALAMQKKRKRIEKK
jgi:cytochrome c biogenesis protein ResB